MTTAQILMLASDALAFDAVVVLWVGRHGTQPVLMPRALVRGRRHGRGRAPSSQWRMPARTGRRAPPTHRPVEG